MLRLLFFVLEIIIKVVVEIFFKILQIIWCEEAVNCKCDSDVSQGLSSLRAEVSHTSQIPQKDGRLYQLR